MQRKSFVPGAALATAAVLAATLTACTGGSGSDSGSEDPQNGDSSAASHTAEPGKFSTLPEPCRLPARGTLRAMLPGEDSDSASPEDADAVYEGTPATTFDTDRSVGCRWKRETAAGTRHLNIDLERVVSYDAAVSDDDKAQEIYSRKELAAKIPSGSPSPSASAHQTQEQDQNRTKDDQDGDGANDGKGADDGKDNKDGDDAGKGAQGRVKGQAKGGDDTAAPSPSGSPTPSAGTGTEPPAASTAPRLLDDLGDAAFLNDRLVTADSGVHRDITIVFRSSNVVVTIEYDQWSADKTGRPGSQELQEKAQKLARELAESISD